MSDARRRAEEALAKFRRMDGSRSYYAASHELAEALEALLAKEDERGAAGITPEVAATMNAHSLAELRPAPPAADEVREAAERCRMRVEHAFDPDCPCDQNTNCYAGAIADMDALLSALAARGGAE